MPTVITQGAASAKGYGFGARATAANYIEDVFSTYLYTGNGSTQTISNDVDLSTKGGMVWLKSRSAVGDHYLFDTSRGTTNFLGSNSTNQQLTGSTTLTAFNNNGFTLGAATATNGSGTTYTSWTFRKQAKFFDVVTYTGNNIDGRTISHNLGSTPGCVIVKNLSTTTDWLVWHRSLGTTGGAYYNLRLNTTAASVADNMLRGANSTTFTVSNDTEVNGTSSNNYVAYLFAHDAGGFGAAGTDNVISCGSFTKSAGVEATITLGYEPQWLLFKRTDAAENWFMIDNMRGMPVGGTDAYLIPNLSSAENNLDFVTPTATGFIATNNFNTGTYIYIAIRRGPMKTPTTGTSVFDPEPYTGDGLGTGTKITTSITVDATWFSSRSTTGNYKNAYDRLRGATKALNLNRTDAETTESAGLTNYAYQDGFQIKDSGNLNTSGTTYISWNFRRAPGFFDVVCYTGTGASATLNHNLGVAPNMVIVKGRSVISNWETYLSSLGGTGGNGLAINDSGAKSGTPPVSSATATTFTLNNGVSTSSGQTYVAYLFATLTGVSKVGSYTGTGTTKQIDCGFTGGARFVLIKRTDSTGDWYVWDSARGIVAGNDPYLLLNSTAAEVTSTDYIDTYSAGFEISSTAPAAINANGGSFIFLAIA